MSLNKFPTLSKVSFGTGTFNSTTGRTINHNLGYVPNIINIVPLSDPSGYLGEYWINNITATSFTVYCSGSTTTTTFSWEVK